MAGLALKTITVYFPDGKKESYRVDQVVAIDLERKSFGVRQPDGTIKAFYGLDIVTVSTETMIVDA